MCSFNSSIIFCVCYLHMQMQTLCRAVEISICTSYTTSVKFFYRGLTEVFIASPFCDQVHEGQVKRRIRGIESAIASKITWERRQRTLRERRNICVLSPQLLGFAVNVGKRGTWVSFFHFLKSFVMNFLKGVVLICHSCRNTGQPSRINGLDRCFQVVDRYTARPQSNSYSCACKDTF